MFNAIVTFTILFSTCSLESEVKLLLSTIGHSLSACVLMMRAQRFVTLYLLSYSILFFLFIFKLEIDLFSIISLHVD